MPWPFQCFLLLQFDGRAKCNLGRLSNHPKLKRQSDTEFNLTVAIEFAKKKFLIAFSTVDVFEATEATLKNSPNFLCCFPFWQLNWTVFLMQLWMTIQKTTKGLAIFEQQHQMPLLLLNQLKLQLIWQLIAVVWNGWATIHFHEQVWMKPFQLECGAVKISVATSMLQIQIHMAHSHTLIALILYHFNWCSITWHTTNQIDTHLWVTWHVDFVSRI